MDVKHVHSTAIAVYIDRWYIKPLHSNEWLTMVNDLFNANISLAGKAILLVERIGSSIFIHVVSGLDWRIAECRLDTGNCITANSEMKMFIDNHWNEVVNLDLSVIQCLLPD